MAKSARSSRLKSNNARLKRNVFGPVEQARAERLNKKLLELAQQAKPSEAAAMEVDTAEPTGATGEAEGAKSSDVRSNTAIKKAREAKKNKIEKKKFRKERNRIAFKKHPMKSKR